MIKNDRWIREMSEKGMIQPFASEQVKEYMKQVIDGITHAPMDRIEKCISYGVSSYGYDVRVADDFRIFTNINSTLVDVKRFDENSFVEVKSTPTKIIESIIIPPNSFALARSLEYFKIPRDILVLCLGKSSYARCGIIVNVTPLEPEWEGHITIELSNTTPLPAKIYANEGIAQLVFLGAAEECLQSYKDKSGKYQGQTGVTIAKV